MSSREISPFPTRGPLADVRVVELGTLIAAPFAARLLAEFGAEVIKIESATGKRHLMSSQRTQA